VNYANIFNVQTSEVPTLFFEITNWLNLRIEQLLSAKKYDVGTTIGNANILKKKYYIFMIL